MKYDVLSLGSVRMDAFLQLPEDEITQVCSIDHKRCLIELGFGEKIPVKSLKFAVGGNTANNAVGLARLGFHTGMIGSMGDGWMDRQALEHLKLENVDVELMTKLKGLQSFGIIINYQGERTILSYYPPMPCIWPKNLLIETDWIYLTSMAEGYEDFYQNAIIWAKANQVKIAFNPGTRQLKVGLEPLKYAYEAAKVLFLNKEEAEELLGMENGQEIEDVIRGFKKITSGVVVVTDGMDGSYATDGDKIWNCPILPANVVERTGAGDAFGSGFLAGVIKNLSIPDCLKWGTVNSASVLGFVGPQEGLLTTSQISDWLEKAKSLQVKEISSIIQ